jgi:hypothetical protein
MQSSCLAYLNEVSHSHCCTKIAVEIVSSKCRKVNRIGIKKVIKMPTIIHPCEWHTKMLAWQLIANTRL